MKAGTDTNIDYESMNAVATVNKQNAATGILSAAVTMPEDTEFNNYVGFTSCDQVSTSLRNWLVVKLAAGEFSLY